MPPPTMPATAFPLTSPLGIPAHLLGDHIAVDIGTDAIRRKPSRRDHGIPAHIAAVSRLVCDFNRDEAAPPASFPRPATGTPSRATSARTGKGG